MLRRKEFYLASPEKGENEMNKCLCCHICNSHLVSEGLSNEERGEINGERLILSTDDLIQISIEYYPQFTNPYKLLPFNDDLSESVQSSDSSNQRRYLLCKGGMRVLHLKKLIRHKYGLSEKDEVDFFYKQELLRDDYSIIDLAYIYSWRRVCGETFCLFVRLTRIFFSAHSNSTVLHYHRAKQKSKRLSASFQRKSQCFTGIVLSQKTDSTETVFPNAAHPCQKD